MKVKGHRHHTRRKSGDSGAAIVEFSIITVALALVLSLLLDIGQLLFLKMRISHVTLQVARDLSVLLPDFARGDGLNCNGLHQLATEIIESQDYASRYETLVPAGVTFTSVSVVPGETDGLPSLSVRGALSGEFRCLFCFLEIGSLQPQFTATVTVEIEEDEANC